jgi:hypothetical protein
MWGTNGTAPMAELDAMLTTEQLLDETKAIIDRNIKLLFNEAIYKKEVTSKLKPTQDEINRLLRKNVIFFDTDNDDDDE